MGILKARGTSSTFVSSHRILPVHVDNCKGREGALWGSRIYSCETRTRLLVERAQVTKETWGVSEGTDQHRVISQFSKYPILLSEVSLRCIGWVYVPVGEFAFHPNILRDLPFAVPAPAFVRHVRDLQRPVVPLDVIAQGGPKVSAINVLSGQPPDATGVLAVVQDLVHADFGTFDREVFHVLAPVQRGPVRHACTGTLFPIGIVPTRTLGVEIKCDGPLRIRSFDARLADHVDGGPLDRLTETRLEGGPVREGIPCQHGFQFVDGMVIGITLRIVHVQVYECIAESAPVQRPELISDDGPPIVQHPHMVPDDHGRIVVITYRVPGTGEGIRKIFRSLLKKKLFNAIHTGG